MKISELSESTYLSAPQKISFSARTWPSLHFYTRLFSTVFNCSRVARRGQYDIPRWHASSVRVLRYLEAVGVKVQITGLEHVRAMEGPCVFIGNHMSLLETLVLPAVLLPYRPATFVLKQSLLEYPIFKHIIQAIQPIAVSRTNPRHDLKVVLEHGKQRLKEGISVIVFPQSTRSHTFEPKQMSSIGVKLAQRAEVPIIPLALKTDALQNGSIIKDFGRIDTSKPVNFAFSHPLQVSGKGSDELTLITNFIGEKIAEWSQ